MRTVPNIPSIIIIKGDLALSFKRWVIGLPADDLGKVRCPVCGTDYDDSVIACPKCGSMSLVKREENLIKKEGRPVVLAGPAPQPQTPMIMGGPVPPPPPPDDGPVYAQPGYGQQYGAKAPGILISQGAPGYQYQPRAVQTQSPLGLGLGITAIMLGMGGMMMGMMGPIMGFAVCGFIGIALAIIAIVLGAVLLRMGQRIGAGAIATGMMGIMVSVMMFGIFYWIDTVH